MRYSWRSRWATWASKTCQANWPHALTSAALGEEAVPADVEAIALVLVGPADASDHPRVRLEDHAGLAVLGQLICGGQAGWSAPGDDRFVGLDDGDGTGILHTGPSMWNQPGAHRLRLRPHLAHDRVLILKDSTVRTRYAPRRPPGYPSRESRPPSSRRPWISDSRAGRRGNPDNSLLIRSAAPPREFWHKSRDGSTPIMNRPRDPS